MPDVAAAPAPTSDTAPPEGPPACCPNCGAPVSGAFCAGCGQRNAPLRQPLGAFLGESFTEYFGLDGRLWRSLRLLLFHPGRLTREYIEGRRVRHLLPLRLYLSATLLFFFLLSVLDPVARVETAITGEAAADSSALVSVRLAAVEAALAEAAAALAVQEQTVDSLQARMDSLRSAFGGDSAAVAGGLAFSDGMEELDEAMDDLGDLQDASSRQRIRQLEWQRGVLQTWPADSVIHPADLELATVLLFGEPGGSNVHIGLPDWMPRSEAMQQLKNARTNAEKRQALAAFFRGAIGQLPTVMFLLLPVFALLLKVIYVRRGWYFSEHLVFALHTHAFAFFLFAALAALLGFSHGAAWAVTVSTLLVLILPVYFFVAQKRVYGQGWIKTGLKALILGWVYAWLLLMLGLVLAFVFATMWG